MSTTPAETLYPLLPLHYRRRDADAGEPLRALLGVFDEPLQRLDHDLRQLHDNWFIETCAEWVVPYIGDLLGVRLLNSQSGEGLTLRAFVANTLAFRRRKGTPGLLERVSQDISGWPAAAVENFHLLATTQNVNHVRINALGTVDVSDRPAMEALGGPFEKGPYNVDIRSIEAGRGRYNIPNVSIFLWTYRSLLADKVAATPALDVPPTSPPSSLQGFYRVSPLGQDSEMWNLRNTSERLDVRQSPEQVPEPLQRFALSQRLAALRAGSGEENAINELLQVFINEVPVDPKQIAVCNLQTWHRPAPFASPLTSPPQPITLAIDPVLGRIALTTPGTPNVRVRYYYGWPAEVGGGTYDRETNDESVEGDPPPAVLPVNGGGVIGAADVAAAIALWNTSPPRPNPKRVVIEITDSLSYLLDNITVPADVHLQIRASRSGPTRPLLVAHTPAPVNLTLAGTDSQLTLEGLWIAARFQLTGPDASKLLIAHCTLVPGTSVAPPPPSPPPALGAPPAPPPLPPSALGQPSLQVTVDNNVTIIVRQSILGPLLASSVTGTVTVTDCIVDGNGAALALNAGTLDIERTTVFGPANAKEITLVEDTIFTSLFTVQRIQKGCPRFSFLPDGSRTPRPFRCQPQLAIAALGSNPGPGLVSATLARVRPMFTSQTFGSAGYARLSPSVPDEIETGGTNESEMGAFQTLEIPVRVSNLRAALDEYLRFGLEAGTFPAVRLRR